jgi:hypothetical protein
MCASPHRIHVPATLTSRWARQDRAVSTPFEDPAHGATAALPAAALARPIAGGVAVLLPAALMLAVVLLPPANHDALLILDFASRWLGGVALYRDLVDVNPPLVFVLNLVPAAIARWTPVPAVPALQLCLLALCALSWGLARRLRRGRAEGPAERATLDALLPLLLVAGGYDFGQREQVMTVAALPWLVLAAARAEGLTRRGRTARLAALLAALGFALKPHFLAIPFAVEGALLLLARRRGREAFAAALRHPVPWTMLAVWLAYAASLPLLFEAYLEVVVGLFAADYLAYAGPPLGQLLIAPRFGAALLLAAAALGLAALRGSGMFARAAALSAAGAALAAIVQQKGWTYHILPIETFALAALAAGAARQLDGVASLPQAAARRAGLGAALAVLLHMAAVGEAPWRQLSFGAEPDDRLGAFLTQELGQGGARVLVLGTEVWPIHPAMEYARATTTLRTVDLWPLQVAYARGCPEGPPGDPDRHWREESWMGPAERFLWRTVGADLLARPPDAVLVNERPDLPACAGRGFDLLAYFRRSPEFAAGFQGFVAVAAHDRYRLYRRRG